MVKSFSLLLLHDATILLAAKFPVCQNNELLLKHSGSEEKVVFIKIPSFLSENVSTDKIC